MVGNHIIYLKAEIKINEIISEEADKSGPTTNICSLLRKLSDIRHSIRAQNNKKCDITNFLKEQKTIAIHTGLSTQAISN